MKSEIKIQVNPGLWDAAFRISKIANNLILEPEWCWMRDTDLIYKEEEDWNASACLSFEPLIWLLQNVGNVTTKPILFDYSLYIQSHGIHSPISQFLPVKPDAHVQV